MDMQELKHIFCIAKGINSDLCIELTIPGIKSSEFIIVLNDNLDYKLNYYENNYNNNLVLNRCADIKIINAFPLQWIRK